MRCRACGTWNRDRAVFCRACGADLPIRCSACGVEATGDARFCDTCGAPLKREDIAAEDDSRKIVTILFADLVGSTALQEGLDPESARHDMDRLFTLLHDCVDSAGGEVVKYTGDGLMAVFGVPEVREDDAVRAVRSAAAMQDRFRSLAADIERERGRHIALRVGINTGEVVVARGVADVVGDAVNIANRLQAAANEGGILVGEETWRLSRDSLTFSPVPPLELRGRAGSVRAFTLTSLQPGRPVPAPFVGRDAELATLEAALHSTATSRVPSLVTVVGAAGVGKSRLVAEFIAAHARQTFVIHARCQATGPSTFAPIADAFRAAAGLDDSATHADVLEAFRDALPPEDTDREQIASVAASLLGVGDPAAPHESFWAARRLIAALAEGRPAVLIVDDAQWAEPLLLDLIEHVIGWSKDLALLVILLARPEIRDVRPSLASQAQATIVNLEGLDGPSARALMAHFLAAAEIPDDIGRRFLDASGGNPLFLRELLRMLIENGALARDGDRWVVRGDMAELEAPPTIHALLAARIERLRQDERSVIERASVVGTEFYRGAVVELVPQAVRSDIDGHLRTLHTKELVDPQETIWIDEPVFRFHHVLLRDAAYRRLLKEARAELHERFADWLESKVGELVGEHEDVIGYHLEQAHEYRRQLGSDDTATAELGRRAALRLGGAAQRSLRHDHLAAAANLSGRALTQIAADDPARSAVLLDRCEALIAIGDVASATTAVDELRSVATDKRLAAWLTCFVAELDVLKGADHLHEVAHRVATAATELANLGDAAGAAKGHAVHAATLARLGQLGESETALDRALESARRVSDRRRTNAVLAAAPLAALWGPSPVPRASGRCLDVLRVVRITGGAPIVEATAVRCQAVLEALGGDVQRGDRMLSRARDRLEKLGHPHALHQCDVFAGIVASLAGDASNAAVYLERAHDGFRALGADSDTAEAAGLLARVRLAQDDVDGAEALASESERLGGDDFKTSILWRCTRADIAARRGASETALRFAREAVEIAESTDALLDHADARSTLAGALLAADRPSEADEQARIARDLFERKGAVVKYADTISVASTGLTDDSAPGRSPGRDLHDRYVAAYNTCDWTAMRGVLRDDFTVVDHRPLSLFSQTGAERWVKLLETMFTSAPESGSVERWVEATPNVGMAELVQTGQADETEHNIVQRLLIVVRTDGDRIERCEVFDPQDETAARVRMTELAADAPTR